MVPEGNKYVTRHDGNQGAQEFIEVLLHSRDVLYKDIKIEALKINTL